MTHESRDRTAAESPDNISAESRDHVLATYREIAERFRLGSSNAARTKVKRAGWTWESPNHPADPLRIRVPRELWDEAADIPPRNLRPGARERRDSKPRHPPSQDDESRDIKGFEKALNALQEQLEQERGRADSSETRVRELTELVTELREQLAAAKSKAEASAAQAREIMVKLDAAQENETRLREERAAAIAEKEAVQSQLDDAKAEARKEGEGRAKAEAKAELLQVDVDRLRPMAERPAARPGLLGRLLGRKRE